MSQQRNKGRVPFFDNILVRFPEKVSDRTIILLSEEEQLKMVLDVDTGTDSKDLWTYTALHPDIWHANITQEDCACVSCFEVIMAEYTSSIVIITNASIYSMLMYNY